MTKLTFYDEKGDVPVSLAADRNNAWLRLWPQARDEGTRIQMRAAQTAGDGNAYIDLASGKDNLNLRQNKIRLKVRGREAFKAPRR